jgi:diguanylate cyclase
MLAKVLGSRAVARTAIAALAVGLFALAGLAIWGSVSMDRATARVASLNEINDVWGKVFQKVNLEDDAARAYLNSPTPVAKGVLENTIGRAGAELTWLHRNAGADNAADATRVTLIYHDYTSTLRDVILLADRGEVEAATLQAQQASLASTSVRKTITTIIERRRLATTEYMKSARQSNQKVRTATMVAFLVDLGLLGVCSLVLLAYQRRIERQAARSRHDSLHDALTGLANRVLLAERIAQCIREANRYEEMPGLLLIDLDRFKEVNDTLGHHVGDELLKEVAARLRGAVREIDTVARLGGDEFAVLLPRVETAANAIMVADRIQEAFAMPLLLNELALEIGGSIGVALYQADGGSAEKLMRHADVAMYAAKRRKLGVAVYEPGLDDSDPTQLNIVGELRRAIDGDQLVLHYQPKALADTGEICGVEALVRWQHPERGLLAPQEFIPAVEEHGLMVPLTRYVLRAALEQSRRWLDAGIELPVSVNIGAQCLYSEAFPGEVRELLALHEVPARLLTLEITESAFIADPARAVAVLQGLEDAGVRLSIDDFGTGYSSISQLRRLRVHEMKLDRGFVTHMRTDAGNSAIVRALLDLGRDFHLQVVAEGVEDRETWTVLSGLGCDVVQGFYLSRPLPAEALTEWLVGRDVRAAAVDRVG